MGVPVERKVDGAIVDHFAEQVGPEERVDLRRLARQCFRHGGVVHERHRDVGVERLDRAAQRVGDFDTVTGEFAHQPFPEHAGAPAGEAAAPTFHTGDTEGRLAEDDRRRRALEHCDAVIGQAFRDVVGMVAVVVVIAEDGDDGHTDVGELVGHRRSLVEGADPSEIACEQQDVGTIGQRVQLRSQRAARVGAEVYVTDCRDPHQCRSSA